MAEVNSNSVVSYENLKDYIIEKIKKNCCNIDTLPNLPGDLDPKNPKQIISGSGTTRHVITVTLIDSGNVIKEVKSSKVEQQLMDFLKQRGLYNKPQIPISSKAMLNIFNNIAIFLSARSKVYKTMTASSTLKKDPIYIFYDDSSSITYDEAPFEFRTDPDQYGNYPEGSPTAEFLKNESFGLINKEEARRSVQSLINQINKTNKITAALMEIKCACSSSSSCSSSSCSSSCSSSSSSFIVYMLI